MVVMNKVVSKKKGLTFPGKYLVTFVTVTYRHGEFLSIFGKDGNGANEDLRESRR